MFLLSTLLKASSKIHNKVKGKWYKYKNKPLVFMAALNIHSTPYLKFIYKLVTSLNFEKPINPN